MNSSLYPFLVAFVWAPLTPEVLAAKILSVIETNLPDAAHHAEPLLAARALIALSDCEACHPAAPAVAIASLSDAGLLLLQSAGGLLTGLAAAAAFRLYRRHLRAAPLPQRLLGPIGPSETVAAFLAALLAAYAAQTAPRAPELPALLAASTRTRAAPLRCGLELRGRSIKLAGGEGRGGSPRFFP